MKALKILLSFLLISGMADAGVDWYGYFESQADGAVLQNESILYGYHKLRVDMEANPGENVRIGVNVNAKHMWGKTTFNLLEYLPEGLLTPPTQDSASAYPAKFPYTIQDTFYLDNMFLQLYGNKFKLILGKQQISPGTGYVWNPTDIFNVKDIMDPAYEQSGVTAIGLDFYPMAGNSVFLAVQPKEDIDHTTWYARIRQSTAALDLSLNIAQYAWTESGIFGFTFIPWERTYKRFMTGAAFSADIAGIGLHGEYAYNRLTHLNFTYNRQLEILLTPEHVSRYQSGKHYIEYLIGADYTFENSLYILTEYFHSDFGKNKDDLIFNDFLQYLSGTTRSINRDYLFFQAMYPVTDLITSTAFLISNLNDMSTVFNFQVSITLGNNVETDLLGSWFMGDDDTEFGAQKAAGRLRLKVYF
jgi:hypothetical protein